MNGTSTSCRFLDSEGETTALAENELYALEPPEFDSSYRNQNYYINPSTKDETAATWKQHMNADRDLETKFETLVSRWERETVNLSSAQEIVLHPAYQQIIGMGPSVVRLILNQLERKPSFWFWALRALTGDDPVHPDERGAFSAMTKAWLEWGREHGYY